MPEDRRGEATLWVSVELGGPQSPTAVAGVRRRVGQDGELPLWDPGAASYKVGYLERITEGRVPAQTVSHVARLIRGFEKRGEWSAVHLVVHAGSEVVDAFREAGFQPVRVQLHDGEGVSESPGGFKVPRRDLIACLAAAAQEGRVTVAGRLRLGKILMADLQKFRVAVTAVDDHGGVWSGDREDLVLAVAMPVWLGEQEAGVTDIKKLAQK